MTYGTGIMFAVAVLFVGIGAWLLIRLGSATISERKTYAYRMTGIMFAAAGVLLFAYALALRSWSIAP